MAAARSNGNGGIALVNMGPTPMFAAAASAAWLQGASPAEAAELAANEASPSADLNASVEYRNHLAKVLTRRALESAAG